jgi:solute carrier family 25 (adenine nucleotide translocator) protein 4/5/6/31
VDTVRRRLMMNVGQGQERKYKNAWSLAKTVYKTEGFKSFYHGGATNIVRGIAGAIVLSSFDELKHFYHSAVSHHH